MKSFSYDILPEIPARQVTFLLIFSCGILLDVKEDPHVSRQKGSVYANVFDQY